MNYALEMIRRGIRAMHKRSIDTKTPFLNPVIILTQQIEDDLYDLTPAEIGENLVTSLLIDGPRETFLVLYGVPVIFDEKEFKVIDLSEIESDVERKKMEQLRDMTMDHHRRHFEEMD